MTKSKLLERYKGFEIVEVFSKSLELKTELIRLGFSVSTTPNSFIVVDYKRLGNLKDILTKFDVEISSDVKDASEILEEDVKLTSYNISTIRAIKQLPGFVLRN